MAIDLVVLIADDCGMFSSLHFPFMELNLLSKFQLEWCFQFVGVKRVSSELNRNRFQVLHVQPSKTMKYFHLTGSKRVETRFFKIVMG